MSVQFFGWDVTFDDDTLSMELNAEQEPKDRGVYTMYHGTSVASARLIIAKGFEQSQKGMLGKGVYVSRDRKKAQRYPLKARDSDRVVLELRVRVGRVKRIDKDDHPLQYTWNAKGYDTAWVPPNCGMKAVPSGLEEDCVFDPKRVQVVGVVQADSSVLSELRSLLAMALGNAGQNGDVCSQCKRMQQQGLPHKLQLCWGCGETICPFMTRHVCRRGGE